MAKRKLRIFLDIDEVLLDFRTAACQIHGNLTHEEMHVRFGQLHDRTWWDGDEFYKPIHELGARFWFEIEPLSWFDDLLYCICRYDEEVALISSPPQGQGRQRWHYFAGRSESIMSLFGNYFDRFHLTPHKHDFAYIPGAVLIDDNLNHVNNFISHGGHAVLFPSLYNSNFRYMSDPVSYVQEKLEEISQCI